MFTTFRNIHYNRGNYSLDYGLKWHAYVAYPLEHDVFFNLDLIISWLEHNPNYQEVTTKQFFIPIGPWKTGAQQTRDHRRADCAEIPAFQRHVSRRNRRIQSSTGRHDDDNAVFPTDDSS